MDTKTTKTKQLPFSVTKQELVGMYLDQMSEKTILDNINEIIKENRQDLPGYKDKTKRQIIGSPKVFNLEFMEFVRTFGVPKDYQEPENL